MIRCKACSLLLVAVLLLNFGASFAGATSGSESGIINVLNKPGKKVQMVDGNGNKTVYEKLSQDEAMKRIAKLSGRTLNMVTAEENKTRNASYAVTDYIQVTKYLYVHTFYTPKLQTIVSVTRDGSFGQVNSIRYMGLDRSYPLGSKEFKGDVQGWVSSNKQGINYIVNGDFYNNGTTTQGGSIGINSPAFSVSYGVSSASNLFKYYNSGYSYMSITGK